MSTFEFEQNGTRYSVPVKELAHHLNTSKRGHYTIPGTAEEFNKKTLEEFFYLPNVPSVSNEVYEHFLFPQGVVRVQVSASDTRYAATAYPVSLNQFLIFSWFDVYYYGDGNFSDVEHRNTLVQPPNSTAPVLVATMAAFCQKPRKAEHFYIAVRYYENGVDTKRRFGTVVVDENGIVLDISK